MPTKREGYAWVTQEMFDKKLEEILDDEPGSILLGIPGVYELVSEYYNNQVLKELKDERDAGFTESEEDDNSEE